MPRARATCASRTRNSRRPRPPVPDRPALLRAASDWPLDDCLANEDWQERGRAVVQFVRRAQDGRRAAVGFVVDLFCLGVREVHVVLPRPRPGGGLAAVHDMLDRIGIPGMMRRIDPFLAAKIVRTGAAYAATLGFPPHPDYAWASVLVDGIDDTLCDEHVPCGRFGKPVVVPEPGLDLGRLISRLERRVGRGGFHLVAPLDVLPEG